VPHSHDQSPPIWRCARCGSLVHPSDEDAPIAWCSKCRRITQAVRDGNILGK
jgi:hypothetical protein